MAPPRPDNPTTPPQPRLRAPAAAPAAPTRHGSLTRDGVPPQRFRRRRQGDSSPTLEAPVHAPARPPHGGKKLPAPAPAPAAEAAPNQVRAWPPPAAASAAPFAAKHRHERLLVERLHSELGRLAQLGARLRAGHDEVGLAADRGSHAAAGGANLLLRLLARHGLERPGQNEALVAQRRAPVGGRRCKRLQIEMLQQPLDRLAVARLVEVFANTAGDLVADIADGAQVVLARAAERVDGFEAQRKRAGRALADVANSQPVDKAVERAMARALDRVEQVLRALLGHPLKPRDLIVRQAVEVVEFLHHPGFNQLADQLVAEAVDIHAALGGEVANRLAHSRRAIDVYAKVADLALLVHDRAAAIRAMRRHLELARTRLALLGHAYDVGNHVAGALDQHGIALAHVLAADFVEVVERGVRNRHAGERHRLELCNRGERTDPPDVHRNLVDPRLGLLGLELERHRPSRRARDLAQLLLERKRVDLGDHAVGFVVERMALCGNLRVVFQHLVDAVTYLRQRIHL